MKSDTASWTEVDHRTGPQQTMRPGPAAVSRGVTSERTNQPTSEEMFWFRHQLEAKLHHKVSRKAANSTSNHCKQLRYLCKNIVVTVVTPVRISTWAWGFFTPPSLSYQRRILQQHHELLTCVTVKEAFFFISSICTFIIIINNSAAAWTNDTDYQMFPWIILKHILSLL